MSDKTKDFLNGFRKEFGEDKICLLGQDERMMDIKVRSSGSLMLDVALGGGYPHGRLVELRGPERSGKTTLLNLAIATAQKNEPEKECAIVDLEYAYNPEWASKLGVNVDKLFISQPDTYAEKVYDMLEYMIKSGRFSIIGVDSVASLIAKEEYENDDWDKESRVGGTSKINSKAMRKLICSGILTNSCTTLVFINQLRDKIGGFSPFGTPTDTPGGRAIKFHCTQQLDVSIGEYMNKGTGKARETLGQQIAVKVAKNKISPPFRRAAIDLYYEYGVDRIAELVNVAKIVNVLTGTSWLRLQDPSTGEVILGADGKEIKYNGAEKTIEAMREDIKSNKGKVFFKLQELVNNILRG